MLFLEKSDSSRSVIAVYCGTSLARQDLVRAIVYCLARHGGHIRVLNSAGGKSERRTEHLIPMIQFRRAQSKSRNLLERLIAFEDETLRFMVDELTPLTNNQEHSENK